MAKHHKETLNFTGTYYYGPLSTENGYGGFNYSDNMEYLNATYWENIATNWCDTGYQNVTAASKGAVGCAFVFEHGWMETTNLRETFSLTSMIAASSWDTDAVWAASSYTYSTGLLKLKASDTFAVSVTAAKIDFATLGKPGDFQNIAAVSFTLQSLGDVGNTCGGSIMYGYQLAFDTLKVKWNGKIPTGGGTHKLVLPPGLASHHHLSPHPWAQQQHAANHTDAGAATRPAMHHNSDGYHSQLLYLTAHDLGGLTNQFHLPQLEHFGL